ncbi:MAG TPA: glycoside hydrolase family 125 protein [Terriglobales bacterium]|nr:glycoside hydrolase family 125 protein [Terriglobales bacterium]
MPSSFSYPVVQGLRPQPFCVWILVAAFSLLTQSLLAAEPLRHYPLTLKPDDVLATGNEWIALPEIRASDGALGSFNVLSMRDRGLLQVTGERGEPLLQPYFTVDEQPLSFRNPSWEVIEYWIPKAHLVTDGIEITLTYCAPPETRSAFLHVTVTNRRSQKITATLGLRASFGALSRVTYLPVELRGERTVADAPWVSPAEVFSFITHDTHFAWAIIHPGSEAKTFMPPQFVAPRVETEREAKLNPGETAEADFVLGAGLEEFSAPHNAKALRELIDRHGADRVIRDAAAWYRARTRTTGQADLDLLMNRNYLFTALYAWGRTLDTEQLVGVTSRSPRYYVSAAYWDRDAMLWSFPGLLDIDKNLAREALEYALTTQLRNAGTHSRFIDGVVLEDGFQLDEGVAPILALAAYTRRTGDDAFLASHRAAITLLKDRLLSRFDPEVGLYSTLQDSQDEYQKQAFLTYDNVLAWRALLDLGEIFDRLKETAGAREMKQRADALRTAILKNSVSDKAPGTTGPIFVCGTDGKDPLFTDVPPGSLIRLPELGFIAETDPLFVRTYEWLHSKNYEYSFSDAPFGLPGSYRLPITTSWSVADHMALARGRDQALKILRTSNWDAGIISEGVNPRTGVMDYAGRAFATAAGYVAHAICHNFCTREKP